MRDDFVKLLTKMLKDRVNGEVIIKVNDDGGLKIYIDYGTTYWFGNFQYINVDQFMLQGESMTELVKNIIWKYTGWLKYNLITKVYFKPVDKVTPGKAFVKG